MTKKLCPYPFARTELGVEPTFVPCCGFWLNKDYHEIDCGEDPWKGPAAIELRNRILKGDYSLCKRELCHIELASIDDLENNREFNREAPISDKVLADIKDGHAELSCGPTSVSIAGDPRCNLTCPTCRSKPINSMTDYNKERFFHAVSLLRKYKESVEVVKMSAEGEVFHSPWLRRLLKVIHPGVFPNLRYITLLSNGTLFSEKNYNILKPGTEYIKEVNVSVDAGDESTYREVRRGNWKQLRNNLNFIASLRRDGKLNYFGLLFVARKANYRSMKAFVELGNELGVDGISFSPFSPWWDMGVTSYEDEAIHLTGHPLYSEFVAICESLKTAPNVHMRIDY